MVPCAWIRPAHFLYKGLTVMRTLYPCRYSDVIMGVMASQITSLTIVHSTIYLEANQRKHQTSASLAFVQGIHRWPVNSPYKWPVTQKMFHLMTSSYQGVIIAYKYHFLTVTPPPSLPHQPHPLHRLSSATIIFVPLCKFRIIIFISCHPSSHIWPVW